MNVEERKKKRFCKCECSCDVRYLCVHIRRLLDSVVNNVESICFVSRYFNRCSYVAAVVSRLQ